MFSVSLPTPAQLAQTPYTRVQTHRKPQNTCSLTIVALRQLSLQTIAALRDDRLVTIVGEDQIVR